MSKYKMLPQEKEIVIRWTADEQAASIWTCDPRYQAKLDKLCMEYPSEYVCIKEEDYLGNPTKSYKCPKKLIAFKRPTRLTEEQRQAARDRMRKLRNPV